MQQLKNNQLMEQIQFEQKSIETQLNSDQVKFKSQQQNINQFNRFDIQKIYHKKNIKEINMLRSNFIFLIPIFKRGGRYAFAIQQNKIPLNFIKIFVLFLICYFLYGWVYKLNNIQNWIQTILLWIFPILFFLFVMIIILDPGFILDHEIYESQYNQTRDKMRPKGGKFCEQCKIFVKVKTVHCYNCHHCVANFDHHCGIIGRCVGGLNLLIFYGFVILANVTYLGMIALFIYEYFST